MAVFQPRAISTDSFSSRSISIETALRSLQNHAFNKILEIPLDDCFFRVAIESLNNFRAPNKAKTPIKVSIQEVGDGFVTCYDSQSKSENRLGDSLLQNSIKIGGFLLIHGQLIVAVDEANGLNRFLFLIKHSQSEPADRSVIGVRLEVDGKLSPAELLVYNAVTAKSAETTSASFAALPLMLKQSFVNLLQNYRSALENKVEYDSAISLTTLKIEQEHKLLSQTL